MQMNTGYLVTLGTAPLLLPTQSNVGDVVAVILNGGTSWTIAQTAGQQIRVGTHLTTMGTGGSVASVSQGDSLELVCTVANTTWTAYAVVGNPTVT